MPATAATKAAKSPAKDTPAKRATRKTGAGECKNALPCTAMAEVLLLGAAVASIYYTWEKLPYLAIPFGISGMAAVCGALFYMGCKEATSIYRPMVYIVCFRLTPACIPTEVCLCVG